MTPISDSELPELARTRVRRAVRSDKKIAVTLHLRHREPPPSPDELGHRPHERNYLSYEEFEERHGLADDDLAEIEAFAGQYGLAVKSVHKAARMVELVGKAGAINEAFGVELHQRDDARGECTAHHGPIHLPETIAEIVEGVTGLDTRETAARIRPEVPPVDPRQLLERLQAFLTYFPGEVAEIYNFPRELDGTGQTIGLIEFGGGYRRSDIEEYFQRQGMPVPEIVDVPVGGARNRPSDSLSLEDLEVTLDLEIAGAVAPGARLVVYFLDGSAESMVTAIKTAVFDGENRPSVLSISYGSAEELFRPQDLRLVNQALREAALMGVTVCVSSGDAGSASGDYAQFPPPPTTHVVFPASSPYVLACGGTRLKRTESGQFRETVWNNLNQARTASGGGVSKVFERPDYQSGVSVPANADPEAKLRGRGVPDVAGNADFETGYRILLDGNLLPGGGTSAVAPLWAGLIARLNQGLGRRVGFINPLLYRLAGSSAFRSITEGDNGAYPAEPVWNACTGLGSPDGTRLLAAIGNDLPVADTAAGSDTQDSWDKSPFDQASDSSQFASTASATAAEAARIAAEAWELATRTLENLRNSQRISGSAVDFAGKVE